MARWRFHNQSWFGGIVPLTGIRYCMLSEIACLHASFLSNECIDVGILSLLWFQRHMNASLISYMLQWYCMCFSVYSHHCTGSRLGGNRQGWQRFAHIVLPTQLEADPGNSQALTSNVFHVILAILTKGLKLLVLIRAQAIPEREAGYAGAKHGSKSFVLFKWAGLCMPGLCMPGLCMPGLCMPEGKCN